MTDPFPFRRQLSLEPIVDYWRTEREASDPLRRRIAEAILERWEGAPALHGSDVDPDVARSHRDVLDHLFRAVLPPARSALQVAAAIVPFDLESIYETESFTRLDVLSRFRTSAVLHGQSMCEQDMLVGKAMRAYHEVLKRFYDIPSSFELPIVIGSDHPETGLPLYFQIEIDTRWLRIQVDGELPALSADALETLITRPMDLELWRQTIPPGAFIFEGFGFLLATEVTFSQTLSLLRNDLLYPDALEDEERFADVEGRLRSLLGQMDLQLGLIALDYDQFGEISRARTLGSSLLLSDHQLPHCPNKGNSHYALAYERREPVIVDNLEEAAIQTGWEWHLRQLGLASIAICPLIVDDRIIGLMELGSPTPRAVSARNLPRVNEAIALFRTALKRASDAREDRVQAVIKRRYTAIHPVVEWRFRRAALDFIDRGDERAQVEAVVFKDVYPLYGLSDIRGSSTHRSDAIRDDLIEQMALALTTIIEASSVSAQPALDEIGYRLGRYIDELQAGQHSGEDSSPLRFLQEDFEPLLDELAPLSPETRKRVQTYRDALDPMLRVVYQKRKAFEDAVTQLNDAVGQYLESRDAEAQKLVPHYFEKYRTDGVDYNIYAGASLSEDRRFEPLHLRNLRLWQLMTMAGCAWTAREVRDELPMALDVTHLILVQSTPMSIRFRPDEKKFDVDGAYNIRYEIIKKRIDKARIVGSGERLTQPGTIAIVYGQNEERLEYQRYIEYLQAAGYFEDGIEWLELEPLQGVQGLRAIRVTVREAPPESEVLTSLLPRRAELTSGGD